MAHPILMPKPGQMTEECVLVAWHKREGDPVRRGDVLFEIETDKSNMDVEAFDDGVLLRRYVEEGQTVPVNSLCAYVGEPGEAIPDEAPPMPGLSPSPGAAAPPATPTRAAQAAPPTAARPSVPGRADTRLAISPRAAGLAASHGLDPASIAGSGPNGRIVERDVEAAIAAAAAAVPTAVAPVPSAARPAPSTPGTGPSLPPVDQDALELAAGEFIAAAGVRGSGPDGRITAADVARAVRERPQPLSRMRQVIARRLTESYASTPHFGVTVVVDMTTLMGLREELAAGGVAYSVTDFIAAAAVRALGEFPAVNGRTDGTTVWLRDRVDLGLAVALGAGLVVPVVRDADRLGMQALHERVAALVAGARAGRLSPDDLAGSTFTISNMGMLGVEHFTAIINPGEAAILAASSIVASPAVVHGGIAIRQLMRMTLSADHRLVDGALAALFLGAVRRRLEDPGLLRAEAG